MNLTDIKQKSELARDILQGRVILPPGTKAITMYELMSSLTDAIDHLMKDRVVTPMPGAERRISITDAANYEVRGSWWAACNSWLPIIAGRWFSWKTRRKHARYIRNLDQLATLKRHGLYPHSKPSASEPLRKRRF